MRVTILTLEHLNRDYPLSGGALRVLSMAEVLKDCGYKVQFLTRKHPGVQNLPNEENFEISHIEENGRMHHNLNESITLTNPDILIVEQWGLIDEVTPGDFKLLCDFHGSLFYENFEKGYRESDQLKTKLYSLGKCDGFLVPGERQYYYFLAFGMMAGLPMHEDRIFKLPLSLPEEFYKEGENREFRGRAVMGGGKWPWVRPGLTDTVEEFLHGQGIELVKHFYKPGVKGLHPGSDSEKQSGGLSHKDIIQEYLNSDLAFDLYHVHRERQLAITTRTVEYLYCGLPVIYSSGLELSEFIERNDFGLVLDSPEELLRVDDLKVQLIRMQKNVRENFRNRFLPDGLHESLSNYLNQLEKVKDRGFSVAQLEKEHREYFKKAQEAEIDSNYFQKKSKNLESEIESLKEQRNQWIRLYGEDV